MAFTQKRIWSLSLGIRSFLAALRHPMTCRPSCLLLVFPTLLPCSLSSKGPHREDQKVGHCKAACEASCCLHKQWCISLLCSKIMFWQALRIWWRYFGVLGECENIWHPIPWRFAHVVEVSYPWTRDHFRCFCAWACGFECWFPDLGGAEPALATEGDKSLGVTKWQPDNLEFGNWLF